MKNYYDTLIGSLKPEIFAPDFRLRPYISHYGFYEGNGLTHSAIMTPVPNGAIELFLHFDESYVTIYQHNKEFILNNYLVGLNDAINPIKIKICASKGSANGMIIRFTFNGTYRLMDTSIATISNNFMTFEEIWGYNGRQLYNALISASDNIYKVKILDNFFLSRLRKSSDTKHLDLDSILHFFSSKNQKISVDSLASNFNLSYRSLHRKFSNETGICPKEYLKIIRFDRICRILSINKRISLSDILHYGGYYDQSHFIHEFKEIMKITPKELLRESNGNFYITRGFRME